MKFSTVAVAAFASVAVATPTDKGEWCTPATYRCDPYYTNDKPGWSVCNTSHQWVFAGNCKTGEKCVFNYENGSPYCISYDYPSA
ncbi:hypothetical protein E4U54_000776 [Claviceps lovelessii]|nr:hypothetical protein E4U54_000776 [Claviceps lovelessii]